MKTIIVLALIAAIIVAIELALRKIYKSGRQEVKLETADEIIKSVKKSNDAVAIFKSNRAVRDKLLEKYTRK